MAENFASTQKLVEDNEDYVNFLIEQAVNSRGERNEDTPETDTVNNDQDQDSADG